MRLNNKIILILILSISSCIDPFIPETTSYDDVLYIECLLSDDNQKAQEVKISHTTPILVAEDIQGTVRPAPVSGATVSIIERDQKSHFFSETDPGLYIADPEFIPEIGKAYQLIVIYNGNTFESDIETMKECPEIDSITFKHKIERVYESSPVFDGYHFYVSTHEDTEGPSYYRWQSVATYYFRAYNEATHIWNGRTQIPASNYAVRYCWSTNNIKGIYTSNSAGLSENKILEYPLHFQSQYGDPLSIRYSLIVRQYAISEKAWEFWNGMAHQINDNGGMYDTQPFRIQGNIRCTSDPSVLVTGIFEAAGHSEKRIYVSRPHEFDVIPIVCGGTEIGTPDFPWFAIPVNSYIIYNEDEEVYFYYSPQCFDCTLNNGSIDKPAFWEDGH